MPRRRGDIEKTNAWVNKSTRRKEKKTVQTSGTCRDKGNSALGVKSTIVPSCVWKNEVKASVNNTWQISPFCHMKGERMQSTTSRQISHSDEPQTRQINFTQDSIDSLHRRFLSEWSYLRPRPWPEEHRLTPLPFHLVPQRYFKEKGEVECHDMRLHDVLFLLLGGSGSMKRRRNRRLRTFRRYEHLYMKMAVATTTHLSSQPRRCLSPGKGDGLDCLICDIARRPIKGKSKTTREPVELPSTIPMNERKWDFEESNQSSSTFSNSTTRRRRSSSILEN